MSESVRAIRPVALINTEVIVPPSKSYTNRALIAAALAEGTSTILNAAKADDSMLLIDALRTFGVSIERRRGGLEVLGSNGQLMPPKKEIFVGNAGTAMRFLASVAALASGETTLTGNERMNQRPIQDLLDALRTAGVRCSCGDNGCPPITIYGGNFIGGMITVDGSSSSQFVSSILLTAPYARRQVTLRVKGEISSLPYIDMTLHVMRSFGAQVEHVDYKIFQVENSEKYIGHEFRVEADASSASYFFAAAAITGGRVHIINLPSESLQGDLKFLDVLSDMGCSVTKRPDESVELRGGKLHGIDVDMNEMPDCVPTLAVVAAFADAPTTIRNVTHLRFKETDRLMALATELPKLGVKVEQNEDGLVIYPPKRLHGATIETYNDHRMAMCFAIAGLKADGIAITNPSCVTKSFPNFWSEFAKVEATV